MAYPNFAGKHAHEALFSAHDFLAYLRNGGLLPDVPAPHAALLFYQPEPAAHLIGERRPPDVRLFAPVHVVERDGACAAVASGFGVGAPVATLVMEHLIAWGVRSFLSLGIAGGLQAQSAPGDVVVCTGAVRDEGVSHHYTESARTTNPSPRLTEALRMELDSRGLRPAQGETWTIDAPYRETVAEARHYQHEGVLTVEMECAALFTVAAARGVDVAAAVVVSDTLGEESWTPRFFDAAVQESLLRVADAGLACALSLSASGGQ